MNKHNLAEGDRIYDLYTGVYKPQVIRVALALDVFSPLDSGPGTAEAVAAACGCNPTGIQFLLDYLSSLKVLEKQGDQYSLSPEAATFLVRSKKSYAGNLMMDFSGPDPWESLSQSIRTGTPQRMDYEIHFVQDAWIESYRQARLPSSLEMWAKAGIDPEIAHNLKILDIACGCAVKSLALVEKSPNAELTCLDTPGVLEVARDLAERMRITSQVQFSPGDLLTAKFGKDRYDVCLLGQITHYLTIEQNQDLFSRIYTALVPGGMLLLDVPMESAQPDENSSFVSLLLWSNSGGRAYSFEEYCSWLAAIGYPSIQQLSERLLKAVR